MISAHAPLLKCFRYFRPLGKDALLAEFVLAHSAKEAREKVPPGANPYPFCVATIADLQHYGVIDKLSRDDALLLIHSEATKLAEQTGFQRLQLLYSRNLIQRTRYFKGVS